MAAVSDKEAYGGKSQGLNISLTLKTMSIEDLQFV